MPLVREIELSCEPQTNSDELSPIGNKFKYHARRFLNICIHHSWNILNPLEILLFVTDFPRLIILLANFLGLNNVKLNWQNYQTFLSQFTPQEDNSIIYLYYL